MKYQNGEDKNYVLDSSSFLTFFENEEGAEIVQELLERAKKEEVAIFVCYVTFIEVFYITFREQGEEEARRRVALMGRLAITRVESSGELGLIAGRLKATHRLSFADAWIAATALLYGSTLVHKDPEFEQLEDEVKALKLPYKLT